MRIDAAAPQLAVRPPATLLWKDAWCPMPRCMEHNAKSAALLYQKGPSYKNCVPGGSGAIDTIAGGRPGARSIPTHSRRGFKPSRPVWPGRALAGRHGPRCPGNFV
jgi:hypothetical protein